MNSSIINGDKSIINMGHIIDFFHKICRYHGNQQKKEDFFILFSFTYIYL